MISGFFDWVKETREYQAWGLVNAITFWFLVAVFLTFVLQLRGQYGQWETLRQASKVPKGVSTSRMLVEILSTSVTCLYVIEIRSAAGVINTLVLLPFFLLISAELWRLKKFRWYECLVLLGVVSFICIDLLSPWKAQFYLVSGICSVLGNMAQPLEMLLKRSAEGLNPRYPVMFGITCAVWTSYGYSIGDILIGGIAFLQMLNHACTYLLWLKFRLPVLAPP